MRTRAEETKGLSWRRALGKGQRAEGPALFPRSWRVVTTVETDRAICYTVVVCQALCQALD